MMKKIYLILAVSISVPGIGQIRQLFEREAAYQHFNGVVYVAEGDSVVIESSFGLADEKREVTSNTSFDIGSITKQFTATAILQLAEAGKLGLYDLINPHLGSLASDRWKKITIHQLLTHTSGIPSLYQTEQGLETFLPETKPIALQELVAKFSDGKRLFAPGEEFSYSNSGYILLAAIIEQVSGLDYGSYLTKNIFEKHHLTQTSYGASLASAKPYYGYRADLLREAPIYDISWFIGAGGVYSTIGDLKKWVRIIASESFLTKELRELFLKSHTNVGYGYGWIISESGRVFHDGGNAGFMSLLAFHPKEDKISIVLTNRSYEEISHFGKSSEIVHDWTNAIWDHMDENAIEILPETKKYDAGLGSYWLPGGEMVKIERRDTTYRVQVTGNYVSRIIKNIPLAGNDSLELRFVKIGHYLRKARYWKVAKYCDGEMKFVAFSGLMSVGMRMIKKKVGKVEEMIPYFVDDSYGLIRMKGQKGIQDLIIYFDEEGRIQGMFEHGFYTLDKEVEMIAYPTGVNSLYVDGLPNAEESVELLVVDDKLIVKQRGRSVRATRKDD